MNKNYKNRIERATKYIEENLNKKITLCDVAKVSHFSEYHFHRIFKDMVGETVNDYITRRRLEKAINTLIFKPSTSITQVALNYAFSSSANFSKAVKLYFGFSPSEIKNPGRIKNSKIGKIFSKYGKAFNPVDLYPSQINNEGANTPCFEQQKFQIEIREIEEQRLCVIASSRGYEQAAISEAWDKLNDWAVINGIKNEEQQRFALFFDNPTVTPSIQCRYQAAIIIDDTVPISSPLLSSKIPNGKYAVFYFKGAPEEAAKTQLSIYCDWLPENGLEADNFPMLEHYLNDVRNDGYVEMEIFIKLRRHKSQQLQ